MIAGMYWVQLQNDEWKVMPMFSNGLFRLPSGENVRYDYFKNYKKKPFYKLITTK